MLGIYESILEATIKNNGAEVWGSSADTQNTQKRFKIAHEIFKGKEYNCDTILNFTAQD